MDNKSWIIVIDERRAGGMLDAAQKLGGPVIAVVVGNRALADKIAKKGFDQVLLFEIAEDIPPEAYAQQVAEAAKEAAPRLVLASDVSAARVLLGAVAAKLGAAVVAAVRGLAVEGESIVVSRSIADGRLVEDIAVKGPLAAIFDGEDIESPSREPVPVEPVPVDKPQAVMRLVQTIEDQEASGLLTASRVVGVGLGVRAKEDLKLIDDLAEAMHAEMACTLSVCDDLRWFPSNRVVGSSHNQIAPDLYIAVGISGQPQHMSGIRDAKVIVAINNDPDARIFKNCHYGILGDLYKIVPELTLAFKNYK